MFKKSLLGLCLLTLTGAALAFNLTDSKGRKHSLAGYQGKWVLVNFWATWCPPCRQEIPDLIALTKNNPKKLVVIGVAMDYKDPKEVVAFAQSANINYPIVLGDDKVVAQIGQITGLPTTYLYNPQGKMVAYNVGALTRAAVERYMAAKGSAAK
ncbi:MAG: thioredoxin [Hydrogenophilales bacterium CG03_land_8_20_14_0_80_62_28]|nr:TlpA family protein disulfide reductase [Betaproteobacteria bacterium]OIO79090.1 MAG: thioredoxin [Hydrogenophilaceae bacterium CG1_02_62_390]PIV24404.1 MAG: thioredoxin [Hydrogenophilales bacterium CG03_land_8_20_14_0_80_62_28]PIW39652.1 MAG: thioredoxin [Hydrogenophilales bacterium CG15_BIG_FIL_POST_REV_8_21_14_020_62_31]PIW71981.1 MAG: thioredoxin [Hydrogenophilales bacterium CG12_big_fil_rev_8_21_14_0_65_61_21]PIX02431.1 MAG: thioredoxin [Hydrogenophilales bacterium CG_4_8_14_3_um_filte